MKLIQARVDDEVFKAFSHYLVDRDMTVSGCVTEWIRNHCVALKSSREVVPAPYPTQEQVVREIRSMEPYPPVEEVAMAKCRHCNEVFPVAEMVKDKSGKFFCVGCVENMRNGQ